MEAFEMKILTAVMSGFFLLALVINPVMAAVSADWNDHAAPFDFLFGNHIDTHQQSRLVRGEKLFGYYYVRYTGELTESGTAIAHHANCSQMPDECIPGWTLQGLPFQATLLEHGQDQHPQWCVDLGDIPASAGFSHFHWLGQPEHAGGLVVGQTYDGYLLKLTALETFFFEHHGGFLVTPGVDDETHANIVTDCG
jgi:hypothetical protein